MLDGDSGCLLSSSPAEEAGQVRSLCSPQYSDSNHQEILRVRQNLSI